MAWRNQLGSLGLICDAEPSLSPTTPKTTTTAKPIYPDQFITVFVIAVNETGFVINNFKAFKTTIWEILTK